MTSVKELSMENRNRGFALDQNYPNPFNPTSRISFSIPKAALTQLKVYDAFGREVATLVNGLLQAGNHTYSFTAKSSGKDLASGVYFYTLKSGSFTQTKKMILEK
jgi:hypothetical protein